MNISEKYRPKTFEDVIGQEDIVSVLSQKDHLNHMIFVGPPGCGKTTLAQIISDKHKLPLIEKNASDDRGIGMVRGEIKKLSGRKNIKIILLDEADSLTPEAQHALRRTIEKSPSIFILTGNYSHKFIDPIKSRCSVYEFSPLSDKQVLKQIIHICKSEGIQIDKDDNIKEAIKVLVSNSDGDMRKAINILEKVVTKGKITKASVLSLLKPNHAAESLKYALEGDLERAQRLIEDDFRERNFSADSIISDFYEHIKNVKEKDRRARLYYRLHKTAQACQVSSKPINPLIHIIGFLSYAWLIPHFSNKCPVLGGEDEE